MTARTREEPSVRRSGWPILDKALEEAGIDRKLVYVTNAVKRFNHSERGKRRIHERLKAEHIKACRQWLTPNWRRSSPRCSCARAVPRRRSSAAT